VCGYLEDDLVSQATKVFLVKGSRHLRIDLEHLAKLLNLAMKQVLFRESLSPLLLQLFFPRRKKERLETKQKQKTKLNNNK